MDPDSDWFEREQLHFAAGAGDLERVQALVSEGFDVDAFDDALGMTPLHYAAKNEHFEVVEFLLERGGMRTLITNRASETRRSLRLPAIARFAWQSCSSMRERILRSPAGCS